MVDWKERYMREVEGLNNEGDPIGGDPPSGLRHQVEMLKKMVIALENQNNDYLNQIRKAGLIVDANFVQGSVMSDIKPVAYMFDHTIQNDETSITIKDRADIVNPLIMKIEGISSVSNIRPLYPASAYEALQKELGYSKMAADAEAEFANEYKAKFEALKAENEELSKQSDEMLAAMRRAVLALAFAAESSKAMQDDYQALSNAIDRAVESKNGDSK